MERYNMINLRPDSPRDDSERAYIIGRIEEKEKQIGGLECVLTFEYHYAGGCRFNTRSLEEAEEMRHTEGPRVIKYWKKEQFIPEPAYR